MNEDERQLRAAIAEEIRADLVCCDMYDQVQFALKGKKGIVWDLSELIPNYNAHQICHWGECAARIAKSGGEVTQLAKDLTNKAQGEGADKSD